MYPLRIKKKKYSSTNIMIDIRLKNGEFIRYSKRKIIRFCVQGTNNRKEYLPTIH